MAIKIGLCPGGCPPCGGGGTIVVASNFRNPADVDLITTDGVLTRIVVTPGSAGIVDACILSGVVYLVGDFTTINGVARTDTAAVNASTGAVLPWNPTLFDPSFAMGTSVVPFGEHLAIRGLFTQVNGVARNGIAVVDTAGALVSGFAPVAAPNGDRLETDGSAIVSSGSTGFIATADGVTCYNSDGSTRWTFTVADVFGSIDDFAVSGGVVYIVGDFVKSGRTRAAALDLATGALTAWNPTLGSGSFRRRVTADATRVYLGDAISIGGVGVNEFSAVDLAGVRDATWSADVNGTQRILRMLAVEGIVYAIVDTESSPATTVNGVAIPGGACALDSVGALTSWRPTLSDVPNNQSGLRFG